MASPNDQIVMTPRKKTQDSTVITVERRPAAGTPDGDCHVAGGANRGLIVNKSAAYPGDEADAPPELAVEFSVWLVSAATGSHAKESRRLGFWFLDQVASTEEGERARAAQDFFKALVAPFEFPRDYVGFIKKIMKLMQVDFPQLRKVEVELKRLATSDRPPPDTGAEGASEEPVALTEARLLEMIESAYPNPLSATEMARQSRSDDATVDRLLEQLQRLGKVKVVGDAPAKQYTRVVSNENQVKVVKQMPKMVSAKQPTIALITAQYCEKLAVDAMIDRPETFVRYTTVGESNVYTLGHIGGHRVVSTKLPTVGHTRQAIIAAGSTTTRLLGTFQDVEYVILVGVAGGVPHYTDAEQHVRLGDVVVAAPATADSKSMYTYCELVPAKESVEEGESSGATYETRSWCPPDLSLQRIGAELKRRAAADPTAAVWNEYLDEAVARLADQGVDFRRPPADTDKLYMSLGGDDLIEVSHPQAAAATNGRSADRPAIHVGPMAAGRQVSRDDQLRQEFARRHGVLAFDTEFDSVLESVLGNRKDCYALVRGVADYKDGGRRKDWQPYAALAAAAFTRALICAMPSPPSDD